MTDYKAMDRIRTKKNRHPKMPVSLSFVEVRVQCG